MYTLVKKKTFSEKVRKLKGSYSARGLRFGLVVSEFNEFLTKQLLEGALDTLARQGARPKDVQVIYVPGAFEIPLAAKKLISKKNSDALIVLAVVIRGDTRHFEQVVRESARGVRELSSRNEIPIILGIIPAESAAQAIRRVGVKHMNKGREWALAAIEMASLMKKMKNR
jgi:6,7-dimethyl-8-ribityllumazine synthase